MAQCQVMKACDEYTNEINSDSSQQKYVHLCKQRFDTDFLKFVIRLEYEYAQVTVDLCCEIIAFLHCSVMVCNYASPFSYLKECVVILKFGSTVLCGLTRETGLTKHNPTVQQL